MYRFKMAILTLVLTAGVPACSKLHPVEGNLVWEDGQPAHELDGGMVYFISSEHRTTSRSSVRDGGKFALTTNRPEASGVDGVPPGEHQVYIIGGDPLAALDRRFCDPATSGLEVRVPPESPVVLKLARSKKKAIMQSKVNANAALGIDN